VRRSHVRIGVQSGGIPFFVGQSPIETRKLVRLLSRRRSAPAETVAPHSREFIPYGVRCGCAVAIRPCGLLTARPSGVLNQSPPDPERAAICLSHSRFPPSGNRTPCRPMQKSSIEIAQLLLNRFSVSDRVLPPKLGKHLSVRLNVGDDEETGLGSARHKHGIIAPISTWAPDPPAFESAHPPVKGDLRPP